MKKVLLLSLFLCAGLSGFSQQGIGVRLGDPSGITYKKYSGDKALEFSIGRTYFIGKGYYNHQFYEWYATETFSYKDYVWVESKISLPIGMNVHYLIHEDWFAVEFDGLQWYYGFGVQFRTQSYSHKYRYKVDGDPRWYYTETDKLTDIDLGADGVIGAEYEFRKHPFRVYTDLTLFMGVIDSPFNFDLPWGIGGRYMF